jgi:SecD/SecF fusion protein
LRSAIRWKLIASFVVFVWALLELIPLRDRPVDRVAMALARNDSDAVAMVRRAQSAVADGGAASFPAELLRIANEESVDLQSLFRGLHLGKSGPLEERNGATVSAICSKARGSLRQGLDLRGGLAVTLEIGEKSLAVDPGARQQQLRQVEDVVLRRIDAMGLAEPQIHLRGDSQVEVQLAGVFSRDNPDLVESIKKPAKLEFHIPYAGNGDQSVTPPGYVRVPWAKSGECGAAADSMLLRRTPELIGKDVKRAVAVVNQYGGYEISLEMTASGAKKFERVTRENIGRPLAIVLDGRIFSAPVIRSAIGDGRAAISGKFSQREAMELAGVLNNPLEVELHLAEMHELGPTMADDVRSNSIRAACIACVLVMIFMVAYYGIAGVVAVLSLALNIVMMLGSMAMFGATITIPAIAALALTVGMAVDSNILIFARIGEELESEKSMGRALACGFRRAFSTIFDANITTLLTAAILTAYGTGSVRGFGIVLAIGVLCTLFCSIVFCGGILDILVHGFAIKNLLPTRARGQRVRNFQFVEWSRTAMAIGAIAIVVSIGAIFLRGNRIYGIDFTGGDELLLSFREKPSLVALHEIAADGSIGEIQAVFQRPMDGDGELLNIHTAAHMGDKFLKLAAEKLEDSDLQLLRCTSIGGNVSEAIRRNAAISLILAMVGILAYVAVRFETGFAIGAVLALVHDVIVTIGIYVLLGHKFSAPMIASILMIVGYSINDTIVVFDRIREELGRNLSLTLKQIANLSINRTLSRTLLTSLTVLIAAMALCLFGAGVMVDIALIFSIGAAVGTFSSIFIASPLFIAWHRGDRSRLRR